MAEEIALPYIKEYTDFIKNYAAGQVTGEEVGEIVVRMAQYFAEHNLKLVLAQRALALVAKEAEAKVDESTGKQISSAKAQSIIEATDEAFEASQAKAHVQNVEQFINALKALQRGVLNEFSHMGNA
jgi:hypothetical protein